MSPITYSGLIVGPDLSYLSKSFQTSRNWMDPCYMTMPIIHDQYVALMDMKFHSQNRHYTSISF